MTQPNAFARIVLLAFATSSASLVFAADGAAPPLTAPQTASAALAGREITKEQAVDMALRAHPGEVIKAYEDTKKGKKTWEVRIKGSDGKKWEVYYEIKTGALIAEESK